MKIWLVTVGEPWPTDSEHPRLLRTGVMATQYAALGDEVTWFNGTFDHTEKRQRHTVTTTAEVAPRLTIVGLHGAAYHRNVSLARIRHHRQVADEFLRVCETRPRPDVIVASMPPLELSAAAVTVGGRWGVPVIVDVRDMWPEIFLEVVPSWARSLARPALRPFYRLLRQSVDGAAAVVGISDEAVDWALVHGTRSRNPRDGSLPMAYAPQAFSDGAIDAAERFWEALGVGHDGVFTACFVGTLSSRVELDTVVAAAGRLADRDRPIRFIVAGSGEREANLRANTAGLANVVMPGWLDAPRIAALLGRAQVGLLPYPSKLDFTRSIPNKVFDYIGGGVPVVTSLRGVTAQALVAHGCGWIYPNGDDAALATLLERLERSPELVRAAAGGTRALSAEFDPRTVYGAFRAKLDALASNYSAERHAS